MSGIDPRRFLVWILCTFAIVCFTLWAFPSRGHGTAEWIQANPAYQAANGTHCCGPTDCRVVVKGVDFVEEQGGVRFANGQFFPSTIKGNYVSAEPDTDQQEYWGCFFGGEWKCFFRPYIGS